MSWVSPIWQALQREASMAAGQSVIGVTALGKANYAQKDYYYQAFFALGIGIERAAKIALVVDHALDNNGTFPSEKEIRRYGHNLKALLESMDKIALKRGLTKKWSRLPHSEIHEGIMKVLSDFANNITRYYNLDLITNNLDKEKNDPIQAWFERVTLPVLSIHYKPHLRERDELRAELTNRLIGNFTSVRHHSETGNAIDSIGKASMHIAMTDFANPYVRMYVMQILRFVGRTISELGFIAHQKRLEDIPYLDEIFLTFIQSDTYFKSRKTWSIY